MMCDLTNTEISRVMILLYYETKLKSPCGYNFILDVGNLKAGTFNTSRNMTLLLS